MPKPRGNPHRCQHPDCSVLAGKDGYCKNHREKALGRTHIVKRQYFGYGFHKGTWTPPEYGIVGKKYGIEE